MESEKVKEIKEWLENENEVYRNEIAYNTLDLINELESENERLLESCKNCHYIKDLEIANGHTKELKDRIAELEKENRVLKTKGSIVAPIYVLPNVETPEMMLKLGEKNLLQQFAERLKEKVVDRVKFYDTCIDITYNGLTKKDIDETLKEVL